MNKDRRNRLTKAIEQLANARTEIEAVKDEEEEALENLPESFQEGEQGEAMQQAIDLMQEAVGSLEEIESNLEEAQA